MLNTTKGYTSRRSKSVVQLTTVKNSEEFQPVRIENNIWTSHSHKWPAQNNVRLTEYPLQASRKISCECAAIYIPNSFSW